MPGTLKVGGNIIASHTGVEGAGTVTLGNVVLGDSAVPTNNYTFRNKIINGNFDIWQRGTSQTNSGYGSADRWLSEYANATATTASQQVFTNGQTEVTGNPKYYLRSVVTTGNGSNDYAVLVQKIENVETLSGKTVTLSFWAKSDANKNIATEFYQYFGEGGTPSSDVSGIGVTTHSLTTSWQKFTTTVSIPSISGKTIGTTGNDYIQILFYFDAGSDYNSRNNSLGNQSGTFDIAQVQIEEGSVPTPFEHRPYGLELSLCQRYFCKFDAGGAPHAVNGASVVYAHNYPVTMRVTPDLTESVVTSQGNQASNYPTFSSYGVDACSVQQAPNVTTGTNMYANYTIIAKAEL